MAATTFVRARVDEELKTAAAEVLAGLGLTVSDAVRMTLTRIAADKALPFELSCAPNAETRGAMAEAREIMATRKARYTTGDALIDDLGQEGR